MSLLVTGSVGIDTVRTPFGVNQDCIGGSAVYFSMAAGFFTDVKFIGAVGDDCPFDLAELFLGKNVDLTGLEVRRGSKTFRWHGTYEGDMNEARTDVVELNVLAEKPPMVPDSFRDCEYVFLANTAPSLQMELLNQLGRPAFVAADTMNLWIETANDDLRRLLNRIDMLVLNEKEAKLLTGHRNLLAAAKAIGGMGPRIVIIKKGEYGSMMVERSGSIFLLPAFPTAVVIDPTGAGDAFAGGLMGYLAQSDTVDLAALQNAMAYGTVMASFTIGDFSIHGIRSATREKIEDRFDTLRKVTQF
ncbi:MAG: PfkB family carbohydrate kinase [Planctomycetales bacterium]|nr:PfkB family carbohydrate kinase [Planctomycetales bacterium]